MEWLVRWIETEAGAGVVYACVLIAFVLRAVLPRPLKVRVVTPLALGLVFASWRLARRLVPTLMQVELDALSVCAGALTVSSVLYVLLVDVLLERLGARPINQLYKDVTRAVVSLLVLVGSARIAGIDATSIVAGGTVLTAVVGLASQETLGNLAAGIAIQLDRPIQLGDWIRLDKVDVMGRVVETNWRAVTIETDERSRFVIPNSVFSKTPFTNFTQPGGVARRRSLSFSVPYDHPPSAVHAAVRAALEDTPLVLHDPAPSVLTWSYDANGMTYWVRYYIAQFAQRDPAQSTLATRLWYHLHRAKIPVAVGAMHTFVHARDASAQQHALAEVVVDRRDAIACVDFLDPLSEASKQRLALGGHRRLYTAGETVVRQGELGRSFYLVRRGRVALRTDGRDIAELGRGEFFGEMALLTGRERAATVTALEESELFEIDEVVFEEVLRSEPQVAAAMSRIVASRRSELEARHSGAPPPSKQDVDSLTTTVFEKLKEIFGLD